VVDKPNPFDALSPAGRAFSENWQVCLLAGLVWSVVNIAVAAPTLILDILELSGTAAASSLGPDAEIAVTVFRALNAVFNFFVGSVLGIGLAQFSLKLADTGTAELDDLIPAIDRMPGALMAATIAVVLMTIGLLACCLPGIAAYAATLFWPFFLVAERKGGLESVLLSVEVLRDNPLLMVLFGFFLMVLFLVGAGCCHIPSVAVVPFAYIVMAFAYRQVRPLEPSLDQG
jgi:hypothetical protein